METFMTPEELSKILKIEKVTIYKWVRLKKVPFFHIEKCVRFDPTEIKKWLETKRNGEYHIETCRGRHPGRPRKKGAGGDAPPLGDASTLRDIQRVPDGKTGMQK